MKRAILTLGLVVALATPVSAQGLFGKKAKIVPSQRVPELIVTVKTDPDERKRANAAEELHYYDVATFTEIVPVLADVLQHDKKVSVRMEAVTSLAKIRPVSNMAGQALEKAAADDESWRVRLHAKTYLPKYHLAGYASSKKSDPIPVSKKQTNEPVVMSKKPNEPVVVNKKQTSEPPIAPSSPPAISIPSVGSSLPRPLPPGVATPPTSSPPVQGPTLFPDR
jgi:hypothetical protein